MKAVSLWQPWASAIPLRYKYVETRGWTTKYRGELAIHAAKRMDAHQRQFIASERECGRLIDPLPLGQVVAVVTLRDCLPIEHLRPCVRPLELLYGDYDDGRFGWILTNIRPVVPFDFKGGQGFFNIPDNMVSYA